MSASRTEYTPLLWVNESTELSAQHMNHLEEGVALNNALAIENALFIDEIYTAFVEQLNVSFNSQTNVFTFSFGSTTGDNPTSRFHKEIHFTLDIQSDEIDYLKYHAMIDGKYYPESHVGKADDLYTERAIEDLEISCPPITYGIAGGDAEIDTGRQSLDTLFGNTVFDEDNQIYKSVKSAKLISRGKNQFVGFDEFIDVLSSQEYRIFTNLPSGLLLTEYNKNKEFFGGYDDTDIGTDCIVHGYDNEDGEYFSGETRYIKLTPVNPAEVTDNTYVMMYLTFGESYNEPYEESHVDEIALPNITLRSFDNVRDEIYATGGGIRRVGVIKLNRETMIQDENAPYLFYIQTDMENAVFNIYNATVVASDEHASNYDIVVKDNNSVTSLVNIYSTDDGINIDIESTFFSNHTLDEIYEMLKNVEIVYKLSEPEEITTEENPGWDPLILIDNYGTLMFVDENNEEIEIEQPYQIIYKISLTEFVDSAYVKAKGNASDLALESDIKEGKVVAGLADSLTPYSENSGIRGTNAFLFQTSGGDSDIGSRAYLEKLTGNTAKLVQLIENGNFDDGTNNFEALNTETILTANDNTLTIKTADAGYQVGIKQKINIKSGYRYLVKAIIATSADTNISLYIRGWDTLQGSNTYLTILNSELINGITIVNTGVIVPYDLNENRFRFTVELICRNIQTTSNYVKIKNLQIIDITTLQETLGGEWDDTKFNRIFPLEYYEYTEGKFISSKSSAYKCVGYNACDGKIKTGYEFDNNGQELTNRYGFITENYIKVIPGQQYTFECEVEGDRLDDVFDIVFYDANKNMIIVQERSIDDIPFIFDIPRNCHYIRLGSATSYEPNASKIHICVHLTWDGSKNGYEPYYENYYRLPNIELRKVGDVYDELKPDGTLIRRIGVVNLGELDWTNKGNIIDICFSSNVISDIKQIDSATAGDAGYILCSGLYKITSYTALVIEHKKFTIAQHNGKIYIITDDTYSIAELKEKLNGIYLLYELAEPVIEQNDAYKFTRNTEIDDFGTQEFISSNEIAVPQGSVIQYPPDYKAFVDTLGNRVKFNAEKINIKNSPANLNVLNEENKIRDFVSYNKGIINFFGMVDVWRSRKNSERMYNGITLTRSQMYGTKLGKKFLFSVNDDCEYINEGRIYGPYNFPGSKDDIALNITLDDFFTNWLLGALVPDAELDDTMIGNPKEFFPEQASKQKSHMYTAYIDDADFARETCYGYLKQLFTKSYIAIHINDSADSTKPMFSKTMIKFGAGNNPSTQAISNLWFEVITRVDLKNNQYILTFLLLKRSFKEK